jgi:membrane-anchored protein YejM (alkaline phosphatase superfamily)
VCALVPALSTPQTGHPLTSMPRYVLVIFPLFMWASTRLRTPLAYRVALAGSAVLLAVLSAVFARWAWVA